MLYILIYLIIGIYFYIGIKEHTKSKPNILSAVFWPVFLIVVFGKTIWEAANLLIDEIRYR